MKRCGTSLTANEAASTRAEKAPRSVYGLLRRLAMFWTKDVTRRKNSRASRQARIQSMVGTRTFDTANKLVSRVIVIILRIVGAADVADVVRTRQTTSLPTRL